MSRHPHSSLCVCVDSVSQHWHPYTVGFFYQLHYSLALLCRTLPRTFVIHTLFVCMTSNSFIIHSCVLDAVNKLRYSHSFFCVLDVVKQLHYSYSLRPGRCRSAWTSMHFLHYQVEVCQPVLVFTILVHVFGGYQPALSPTLCVCAGGGGCQLALASTHSPHYPAEGCRPVLVSISAVHV